LDGQIWALKADSLTSPLIVTVTVKLRCGLTINAGQVVAAHNRTMLCRARYSYGK